jgi:hypothetical protein
MRRIVRLRKQTAAAEQFRQKFALEWRPYEGSNLATARIDKSAVIQSGANDSRATGV